MPDIGLQLNSIASDRDVILAIGTFDGVHLGHRHLVGQVVRRAREKRCLSGAITFHPHPRAVVKGQDLPYLCSLDERLALLRGLGLDLVVALPFTRDLSRLTALEFMSLLCQSVHLHELWVGTNFALGRRREGTAARLAEIGRELGYKVHGVPPLILHGQTVSSTRIRELVAQGQVESAAELLARRHRVRGIATPGDQHLRHLGISVATVVVSDGLAVPDSGVYAARVQLGSRCWSATAHVAPNPTGTVRQLEVSLPRCPEDVGGQPLRVEFVQRLWATTPDQLVKAPVENLLAQSQVLSPA